MSNLHPVFEGIINKHFPKKVEDAEVVEENHRMSKHIQGEFKKWYRCIERDSMFFWEFLEYLDVVKGYSFKKGRQIGKSYWRYQELIDDFASDWYGVEREELSF